jgi:hypothetical protein
MYKVIKDECIAENNFSEENKPEKEKYSETNPYIIENTFIIVLRLCFCGLGDFGFRHRILIFSF